MPQRTERECETDNANSLMNNRISRVLFVRYTGYSRRELVLPHISQRPSLSNTSVVLHAIWNLCEPPEPWGLYSLSEGTGFRRINEVLVKDLDSITLS